MSLRQFIPPPYQPVFTTTPGTCCWLPGSDCFLKVFPTAFQLFQGSKCLAEKLFVELGENPSFTAYVDAIHQRITVEGHSRAGFFRYRIEAHSDGVLFSPVKGLSLEKRMYPLPCVAPRFPLPRLMLGCHKAACWERISHRPTLTEMMPLWHLLGREKVPIGEDETLLGQLAGAVQRNEIRTVGPLLLNLFAVGIQGIFVPKREDDLFLGFSRKAYPDALSLSQVHSAVSTLISSMFVREEETVQLLPCVPVEAVSGRIYSFPLASGHLLSLEWRKGTIRRLLLRAACDDTVTLSSPAQRATLRCIESAERKKPFSLDRPLVVQQGKRYLLDNWSLRGLR